MSPGSTWGRIVLSRHSRNWGRSLGGRPISARKMPDGSGVASSAWKSHEPRPANPSSSSRTSLRTSGSNAAIALGVKRGFRIRR